MVDGDEGLVSARPSGFYWVRWHGDWVVAEWARWNSPNGWIGCSRWRDDGPSDDSVFEEIGAIIEPPELRSLVL